MRKRGIGRRPIKIGPTYVARIVLAAVITVTSLGCMGAFKRLQDQLRNASQERQVRKSDPHRKNRERSPVRVKKELPNGLTLVVQENFGAPVTAVQVWLNVGSADEAAGEAGISHFIEHLVFKGTKKRGPGEVAREVESLGGDLNAFTSYDNTVFHVTIASRYFERALDILSDLCQNPSFDPGETNREREVILEEIRRGKDAPQSRLYKYLFAEAYKVHPYSRPVIGFEDTVRAITRDHLVDYFKKWYVASNMTVVVTGDVDADQVTAAVKKYFGAVDKGNLPARKPGPRGIAEPAQPSPRPQVFREDVSETYLALAFHVSAFTGEDAPALDVLSVILGGGESSRLVYRVRTERRLTDKVWAYANTPRDAGLFLIGAELPEKKADQALDMVLKQTYLLKHEPVEDWELDKAKLTIESDGIYAQETVDGQARQIGFFSALTGNPDYEKVYLARIKAVTREDLRRVAAKYFEGRNLTVVAILPTTKDSGKKGKKRKDEFDEDLIYRIIEDNEKWDQKFAAGVLPEPNPIVAPEVPVAKATPALSEKAMGAAAPVKFELKNGVRLIVRENHAVPLVSVRAAFEGGVRRESPDQSGIGNFIAEAITEGTVHYSAAQIHSFIEARSGSISGFSGRNSMGVTLEVPSPYFLSCLPLFGEVIQYPTFPEDEMDRIRGLIISNLKSQLDQPRVFAFRLFRSTLYKQHPYGMDLLGTETTVQQITHDSLQDFYQRLAVPGNLVIAVVGDVKADEVKKAMEELFKDWVAEPFNPAPVALETAPDSPQEAANCQEGVNQTNIVIGFQGSKLSSDDGYDLEVLSSALSGMSGRLFNRLRDKQSLAYSVYAFNEEGMDPGFFGVYIGTAPEKEKAARDGLQRELQLVRDQPLTALELQRAQQVLIGDFEIGLQRYKNQAARYALDELYGLGFRYSDLYADKIGKVTLKSAQDTARKYLVLNSAVTAVVRPCSPEVGRSREPKPKKVARSR